MDMGNFNFRIGTKDQGVWGEGFINKMLGDNNGSSLR